MAGIDNPNLVTFFEDTANQRNSEYPGTPFTDVVGDGTYNTYLGVNAAGCCAPGIGINTGDYVTGGTDTGADGADASWSLREQGRRAKNGSGPDGTTQTPAARANESSEQIGQSPGTINAVQGTDRNDTLAMVRTTGSVAPGGALSTGVINRTGKTVPANTNVWGTRTIA